MTGARDHVTPLLAPNTHPLHTTISIIIIIIIIQMTVGNMYIIYYARPQLDSDSTRPPQHRCIGPRLTPVSVHAGLELLLDLKRHNWLEFTEQHFDMTLRVFSATAILSFLLFVFFYIR